MTCNTIIFIYRVLYTVLTIVAMHSLNINMLFAYLWLSKLLIL